MCARVSVRDFVLERDNYMCRRCGTRSTKKNPLTLHHIVFRSRGGKSTPDNLITWCSECHRQYHKAVSGGGNPYKVRKKRRKKC